MRLQESASDIWSFPEHERRNGIRFPIKSAVRWVVLNRKIGPKTGKGETMDFSSSGLSFLSDVPLSPGWRVELDVDWPAELDGHVPMKLVASGRVVRVQGHVVCVTIEKKEFRTAGRKADKPGI
jgi:hypothetical protein